MLRTIEIVPGANHDIDGDLQYALGVLRGHHIEISGAGQVFQSDGSRSARIVLSRFADKSHAIELLEAAHLSVT